MRKILFIFFNYFILLILFAFVNTVEAQKSNEVLLKLINQKGTSLGDKYQYFCGLSIKYAEKDSAKAFHFARQAMQIANDLRTLKRQVIAYDCFATIARRNNDIKKEIYFVNKCIAIASKSNDEEVQAYANYCNAYKFRVIGEQEKYVVFILKSIAYFETAKKRYDKIVGSYENLAAHFGDKNDINIYQKYAQKALEKSIESKNNICLANGLITWGTYIKHRATAKQPVKQVLLDSASNCYLKAIKLFENSKEDFVTHSFSYGRACNNLSSLYLDHFFDSRRLQTVTYLNKTEKVCLKINNPTLLMSLYGQQSQFYINQEDVPKAQIVLNKVEKYIKMQPNIEPRYKGAFYYAYMQIATLKNDFKMYRDYFLLFDQAVNEMNTQDNKTRDYNAAIKFETEQKNREIKSLTAIASQRKKINYLLITIFILGFLTLLFIYKSFQFRHNANIKANELLRKENEEANLLSKLKEEEAVSAMLELEVANRERKMAIHEKLLTEKQKEKLQHDLMTNNLHLESKKIILKEIQDKLPLIKSEESKQISRTINKSIEVDEEFELLKLNFENANPIFFSTLQEKASNNLTKLDLKYCGYMKLGMGTKEIANIMNIEVKSMRMARYRIRQKLNLTREEDLEDFINII